MSLWRWHWWSCGNNLSCWLLSFIAQFILIVHYDLSCWLLSFIARLTVIVQYNLSSLSLKLSDWTLVSQVTVISVCVKHHRLWRTRLVSSAPSCTRNSWPTTKTTWCSPPSPCTLRCAWRCWRPKATPSCSCRYRPHHTCWCARGHTLAMKRWQKMERDRKGEKREGGGETRCWWVTDVPVFIRHYDILRSDGSFRKCLYYVWNVF